MATLFFKAPPEGISLEECEAVMPTNKQLRDLPPPSAWVPNKFFQHPDYIPLHLGDGNLPDNQAAVWAINRIFGGVPWVPYLHLPPTNHPATGLGNGHAPNIEPLWICSDKPGAPQGFYQFPTEKRASLVNLLRHDRVPFPILSDYKSLKKG
jgi:hypothetical protein